MTRARPHPGTPATTPSEGSEHAFVPGAAGRLLSRVYSGAVGVRNRRFDRGRGVVTFDRPVISVGNLTLGGTGKTPMVERIVETLREHGVDPCIAMRGYGSRRTPDRRSDEAELYRSRFPDIPVIAQPNRVEGLIGLFGSERGERVDCVVLDDGFQHRRIARQLDLVLLDASQDPFRAAVFPAGTLREPAANIGRATHVALTHAELVSERVLAELSRRAADAASVDACAIVSHDWRSVRLIRDKLESSEPVAWFGGKRVVGVCGIGRPAGFFTRLDLMGAETIDAITLPDHDPFRSDTLERIVRAASGADAIVLTEKDWTKLADRPVAWPCPVAIPRLEMVFRQGWSEFERDLLAAATTEPA